MPNRCRRPNKLMTTVIMGVTALFLAWSHNVKANETNIYKCTCANGQIIFQDLICPPDAKIERIKLPMNQSADNPAGGLREQEKQMLALAHEGASRDKEHQQNLQLAKLQQEKAHLRLAQANTPQTHVHIYPPIQQVQAHNINQNQIALALTKVCN